MIGTAESDPEHGRTSTASPIGKGLLGKRNNDMIKVETPGGILKLEILDFT